MVLLVWNLTTSNQSRTLQKTVSHQTVCPSQGRPFFCLGGGGDKICFKGGRAGLICFFWEVKWREKCATNFPPNFFSLPEG